MTLLYNPDFPARFVFVLKLYYSLEDCSLPGRLSLKDKKCAGKETRTRPTCKAAVYSALYQLLKAIHCTLASDADWVTRLVSAE